MKGINACAASMLGLLLSLSSGCVVVGERSQEVAVVESDRHGPPPWAPAHGWRRKHETYYYYPSVQVYYYPSVRRYYWLEGREWRYGGRLPRHYLVDDHKRVVLELDDEPHKNHAKIKDIYPPDYHEKNDKKGKYRW